MTLIKLIKTCISRRNYSKMMQFKQNKKFNLLLYDKIS